MAATLQPTTAPQSFTPGAAALSDTEPVTVDAGINRCMTVLVQQENNVGGTASVSSITYGGVALTFVAQIDGGTWSHTEVWRLIAPAVGTADVVVNVSESDQFTWGVLVGQNVDQTTPLRTAVTGSGDAAATSTLTVAGVLAGDLVFDTLAIDATGHAPVPGAGQTERWDLTSSSNVTGACSTQLGSAGGDMTYTWTTAADYSYIACAFIGVPPPTFVGAVSAAGTKNLLTLDFSTVDAGTPPNAGDTILVAIVHSDVAGNDTSSNGFVRDTAAAGLLAGSAQSSWGYKKVAVGGETTVDFTFDHSAGTGTGGVGIVVRGADPTTPINDYDEISTGSAATTITTGPITTDTVECLLVIIFLVDAAASGDYSPAPTGMTERIDAEGLTGTFLAVAGYTEVLAATVSATTRTGTYNAAFPQCAHSWAVAPPQGAPPPPGPVPITYTARSM